MSVLNNIKRVIPGALMLTIIIIGGCANNECLENKNSLPLAGFYTSDSIPTPISLDSISIIGIGVAGDSVLHDSVRNLTQTYLPFRIDQSSTAYEIRYLGGDAGKVKLADTIVFNYDIKPWFVSIGCGVSYQYEMKSIETTHYAIDSVTCPVGVITNANIQNLHIYFKVSTEDIE